MEKLKVHSGSGQKVLGCVGALLQVGLLISDFAEPDGLSFGPFYAGFAMLFLVSIRFAFLEPLQAALFFALTGMQTADSLNPFAGLGFAIVAVLIIFRGGWFSRKAMTKAAALAVLGSALLIFPIASSGKSLVAQIPVLICAMIYSFLVFGLAKNRFLSALAPKKRVLKLADYKLTEREIRIVKGRLLGQTVKELAWENELAESTVRNVLSFAYRKLGLGRGEELMAMGERYLVE